MTEILTGHLFDVYPNETDLTVWLIADDGRRLCFVQDFAPCLYAAGPAERLRQLWKWLKQQPVPVRLSRAERRDVFSGMVPVLSIEVLQPVRLDKLFRDMVAAFPDLNWYDADISIPLRYMAAFDVFPLARVRVEVQPQPQTSEFSQNSEVSPEVSQGGKIISITPLDTPWELDPIPASLRILSLEPDCDPSHAEPRAIIISYGRIRYSLPLDRPTPLLASLRADLRRYDPDIILTSWGDTWLLPLLMKLFPETSEFSKNSEVCKGGTCEVSETSEVLSGSYSLSPPFLEIAQHPLGKMGGMPAGRGGQTRTSEAPGTSGVSEVSSLSIPLSQPDSVRSGSHSLSPPFSGKMGGMQGGVSIKLEQPPLPKSGSDLGIAKQAEGRVGLGGLPLNRDASQPVLQRKEHTYFSYGQIVYRGAQVLLRGRWHLDRHNAMLWHDYGLEGVLEMARVTRQPVQEAARLSPGTGISSMQFITALQNGILIPWHKAQAETPKSAMQLLQADMGGMVYQPTVGLHRDVGGIDFVSMYPGIMVRFNISPEVPRKQTSEVSETSEVSPVPPVSPSPLPPVGIPLEPAPGAPGIIPRTLAPLLHKRLALKSSLLTLNQYDCRRPLYQALASAHKWLLVTCFGYLGYKNARFGRIEAHEAVTAYGREALLRAKEAAEDLGFEILHMYVDGLWVHRQGCKTPADFASLLDEVAARTGLPISMDGVYRWVVFLPSRVNARVPVPNRYFGVFQDGSIKVRGIEARRRDTAPFIAETQLRLLEILSLAEDADHLKDFLPQAHAYVRKQFETLRKRGVPLEQLLVSQKLSRELTEYSSPSPAARAVWQLQAAGRTVRPGQRVRFLFTLGKPGVRAWDLPAAPDPRTADLPRYRTLLERAVQTILAPIEQSVAGGKESECLYLFPAAVPAPLPVFE